jgi:hypothetical protein
MKKGYVRIKTSWLCLFMAIGVSLGLASSLHSQTQRYTDDQLLRIGQDVYLKRDYVGASLFLFAYIQKNPQLMSTNAELSSQVQSAYQYSLNQVRSAWTVSLKAQGDAGGSTTSGLSSPPPPLRIPPNAK